MSTEGLVFVFFLFPVVVSFWSGGVFGACDRPSPWCFWRGPSRRSPFHLLISLDTQNTSPLDMLLVLSVQSHTNEATRKCGQSRPRTPRVFCVADMFKFSNRAVYETRPQLSTITRSLREVLSLPSSVLTPALNQSASKCPHKAPTNFDLTLSYRHKCWARKNDLPVPGGLAFLSSSPPSPIRRGLPSAPRMRALRRRLLKN